jgi:Fuc2NAc and GlcNAc transferase
VTILETSILFATFCASVLGSGIVWRYALQGKLLDIPNTRSAHALPTPRGGGLAIASSFFAGTAALSMLSLLDGKTLLALSAAGAIAVIGFLDDKRPLSAKLRFGVHVAAAIFAVAVLGGLPTQMFSALGPHETWVRALLAVFALAWTTNLFNFMDGIDGLAASEAIFMSGAGAVLNYALGGDAGMTTALACLAAASGGFLVWNWPPARLFMGDVGSGFLGFTLTVLAIATRVKGGMAIGVWAILGGVFLIDASITLLRRMLRGDRWMEPHNTHAYQRLARRWHAHLPVTLLAAAVNLGWLFPWAWYASRHPEQVVFCVVCALSPLAGLALFAGAGKP